MAFLGEVQAGRPADTTGLHPRLEAPFFSLLLETQSSSFEDLSEDRRTRLIQGTVSIVRELRQRTSIPDFWRNAVQQGKVRSWLGTHLDDQDLVGFGACEQVADELMSLAKRLHLRWQNET